MEKSVVKKATIIIWAIVVATVILYYRFFYFFSSLTDIIIAIIPTIVFLTGALLAMDRDQYRVKMAKKNNEYVTQRQLNWGMAMRHDLLIYIIPAIILSIPLAFGDIPDLTNITQAIIVFAALGYTKYIYWDEL